MKKKKKVKEVKWTSGINSKSTMSYEKYLKTGLEMQLFAVFIEVKDQLTT